LFLAFLLTIDFLGMLLGGIVFVFLALSVLGERTPKQLTIHALVAVISVGAMWAIFTFALRVILPEGTILSIW
jgi:predicted membrane-bound spermidine synthase